MSLATPQTVTINVTAHDLNRTTEEKTSSKYTKDDGTITLTVSHQQGKSRIRRMVRLDQKVVAADPLTSVNSYQTAGVYIVIDEPNVGFSDTDLSYLVTALKTWLTAGNISAVLASRH